MFTKRSLSLNNKYYAAGVIADAVIVTAALLTAVLIRFGDLKGFPVSEYLGTALFFFLGYYMTSVVENLYSLRTTLNRPMLLYRTMRMVLIVTGAFILLVFLSKETRNIFINSRFVIVLNMFAFLFYSLLTRLLLLPGLFSLLYSGKRINRSNLLVVGNPDRNQRVTELLRKSRVYSTGERILPSPEVLPETAAEIASAVKSRVEKETCSGAVVLFDSRHSMDCIASTCKILNDSGIPIVIYGPELFSLGYFDPWFSLHDYGAIAFIMSGGKQSFIKLDRITDVFLAVLGIVVLSPLLLVVALAVMLSSKGPVLFKQERVGKNQKTFQFLKFRSMKVGESNAEAHRKYFSDYAQGRSAEEDNDTFKLKQPARITAVGRIIRKTSIDELPQLINVLRGEMTIVGPRPCIPYELEHYHGWQRRRFLVKPGLTGIWQVYGRSRLPFDKAQFLDFLYILDASGSLDFRLIMKTIPVVLFGKGGL